MRHISFIYIEKTMFNQIEDEKEMWREVGFEYVPFHYVIDFASVNEIDDKPELKEIVTKGRPLNMNNGLIRDSFISTKGIGILVVLKNDYVNDLMYDKIGQLIKELVIDLGIDDYQLVSNFENENKKIDIIKLNNSIKHSEPECFLKLKTKDE